MKKIYSTLGLIALFLGANAQVKFTKIANPKTIEGIVSINENNALKTAASATLTPPTFMAGGCATNTSNIVYYTNFGTQATANFTVNGVGYSYGTNSTTITLAAGTIFNYNDKFAQKYNVSGNASVTGVLVATAKSNGTGVATAKVYSENATTKAPNAQVGASATKVLNTFTNGGLNLISFASPISVTAGNFFTAIEVPTIGGTGNDTLSIFSTVAGCSTTDSLSWIYENYSNPAVPTGWSSVKTSTGSNLDYLIFAVVDIPSGINNSISKGNLTLSAAYPNPATNNVSINFGLSTTSNIEIEIYDVTGKLINTSKLDNLQAGNHVHSINTSELSSGVYMYSVKTNTAKMFSKFTVSK